MSNDGPLGQPRGIGFGILMYIITLSFYSLYWAFKTQEEMKQHTGEGIGGVFGLVIQILISAGQPLPDPVRDRKDVPGGRPGAAGYGLDRPLALPLRDPASSRRSSGS